MGVRYCEIIDVKTTAKALSSDFDRDDPSIDDEINRAIDQASDLARTLLHKKYSIVSIDANIPPSVRDFTKVKASLIIMRNRTGISGGDQDQIELKSQLKHYKNIFTLGNLVDDAGAPIDQTVYSSIDNSRCMDFS